MSPSAVHYPDETWPQPMNLSCANCEEPILRDPYEADGVVFCCAGCAHGGPCICTYLTETDPRDVSVPPTSSAAPSSAAPGERAAANAGAQSDAVTEPRDSRLEPQHDSPIAWPATFAPQPAERPAILRVTGLATQGDVLLFGGALEHQPEIEGLSLVRPDLDDVWFAVVVASPEALAAALMHIAGFAVDARPHPAGVDAVVRLVEQAATGSTAAPGS